MDETVVNKAEEPRRRRKSNFSRPHQWLIVWIAEGKIIIFTSIVTNMVFLSTRSIISFQAHVGEVRKILMYLLL